MKRFIHYIQHDQMDCGPTCLRMVATHYGKRYSLEGLREKCFLTREGDAGHQRGGGEDRAAEHLRAGGL